MHTLSGGAPWCLRGAAVVRGATIVNSGWSPHHFIGTGEPRQPRRACIAFACGPAGIFYCSCSETGRWQHQRALRCLGLQTVSGPLLRGLVASLLCSLINVVVFVGLYFGPTGTIVFASRSSPSTAVQLYSCSRVLLSNSSRPVLL
jgi:hypothetical protein